MIDSAYPTESHVSIRSGKSNGPWYKLTGFRYRSEHILLEGCIWWRRLQSSAMLVLAINIYYMGLNVQVGFGLHILTQN